MIKHSELMGAYLEVVDRSFSPSVMTWIVEVSNVDDPDEDANARNHFG